MYSSTHSKSLSDSTIMMAGSLYTIDLGVAIKSNQKTPRWSCFQAFNLVDSKCYDFLEG